MPIAVVKVAVNGAGINHPVGKGIPVFSVPEVIHIQLNLNALQHPFHHGGIATHRDTLKACVEIVVVEGEADRQPPDDKGGEL